jgi:sugar phosphate isomerase/epimerase
MDYDAKDVLIATKDALYVNLAEIEDEFLDGMDLGTYGLDAEWIKLDYGMEVEFSDTTASFGTMFEAFEDAYGDMIEEEDGEYVLDALYSEIGPDLLATEIDTCWVNVGGENPCDYVRKYTGRAPVVHLKDFHGKKSQNMYKLIGIDSEEEQASTFEFRPLGHGVQNVQAIVDSARDAGASWIIAEQDEPSMGKSRLECAQMSMDYMKNINY